MADMNAPLTAAAAFSDIASAVRAYIDSAKAAAADGLTWAEFGHLMTGLIGLAVRLARNLAVPGPEKKELVLVAVAALFDSVAGRCVPLVLAPIWIAAKSPARALVLALASGAVEAMLPLVRNADA